MVHFERDYLASVESMNLNEVYASVLFDGKLQLHTVSNISLIKIYIATTRFTYYSAEFKFSTFLCFID